MSKSDYRFFTKEEDQIIIENYSKMGSYVANLLENRSRPSVLNRARKLGLRMPDINNKKKSSPKQKITGWTKEEDYLIRKHGMEITDDLMMALPNRSCKSIERRIQQLIKNECSNSSDITFPLNVYVEVFGTYKGYEKLHCNFEVIIDRYLERIIQMNPDKQILAKNITRAFIMRYRDKLPSYDISRELNVSEESVDIFCAQCVKILKRTMIRKQ